MLSELGSELLSGLVRPDGGRGTEDGAGGGTVAGAEVGGVGTRGLGRRGRSGRRTSTPDILRGKEEPWTGMPSSGVFGGGMLIRLHKKQ